METHSSVLFSVIVPSYNRAHLIPKTIYSVLDQVCNDFEIIVVDDGSTDDTEAVIDSIQDERIRYIKVDNGERGRARNTGVDLSSGKYITFLDSDDIFYRDHLQQARQVIESHSSPEVFHLGYEMVNEATGRKTKYSFNGVLNERLLRGNLLSCMGVFTRRDVALEFRFDEDRALAGTEDWHLWLRLAARYPIVGHGGTTAALIDHQDRSVATFDEKKMLDRAGALISKLKADPVFVSKVGAKRIRKIHAHMLTYIALHAAIELRRSKALQFMLAGFLLSPSELVTKRTLVITWKVMLSFVPIRFRFR